MEVMGEEDLEVWEGREIVLRQMIREELSDKVLV